MVQSDAGLQCTMCFNIWIWKDFPKNFFIYFKSEKYSFHRQMNARIHNHIISDCCEHALLKHCGYGWLMGVFCVNWLFFDSVYRLLSFLNTFKLLFFSWILNSSEFGFSQEFIFLSRQKKGKKHRKAVTTQIRNFSFTHIGSIKWRHIEAHHRMKSVKVYIK